MKWASALEMTNVYGDGTYKGFLGKNPENSIEALKVFPSGFLGNVLSR